MDAVNIALDTFFFSFCGFPLIFFNFLELVMSVIDADEAHHAALYCRQEELKKKIGACAGKD